MKEYNLTTETYKCHNKAESIERDEMVYNTFMELLSAHRRGLYDSSMKIRLSFFNWSFMERALNEMECDGTLSLMHHEMGTTKTLWIELVPADWGIFRK